MKKFVSKFEFQYVNIDSLRNLILKGIIGYSTDKKELLKDFNTLWLKLKDESVLKIQSKMNDIDGWNETGSLVFNYAIKDDDMPSAIMLSSDWMSINNVNILTIEECDVYSECGIRISNLIGNTIDVVCGAFPFSVQLEAAFSNFAFEPEYDLHCYKIKECE